MSLSDYIKEQEDEVIANETAELDKKISDLFTSAIDEPITDEKIEEFAEENGTTAEEVKAKAFALLTNLLVNGTEETEEESEETTEEESEESEEEEVDECTLPKKVVKEDADDASRVNGFRLYTLNPEITKWISSPEMTEAIEEDRLSGFLDRTCPEGYGYNFHPDDAVLYFKGIYGFDGPTPKGIDINRFEKNVKDEFIEYYDSALMADGNGVQIIDDVLLKDYIEDSSINRRDESYHSAIDMIAEGLSSSKR